MGQHQALGVGTLDSSDLEDEGEKGEGEKVHATALIAVDLDRR